MVVLLLAQENRKDPNNNWFRFIPKIKNIMKGVKEQTLPDGYIVKAVRNNIWKSDRKKPQKTNKQTKKPHT